MVIYVYIIEICEVLQIMYYVFSMILFLYYELCLGFYYKPHHHIPIQLAQNYGSQQICFTFQCNIVKLKIAKINACQ